jgi:membrane-bound serine protease (ClpP class)
VKIAAVSRALGLLALALAFVAVSETARAGHVNEIEIEGVISAASAKFIEKAIDQSERDGAEALLIALDTPGGVLDATKDIVQALLNSEVPTIVYVAPQGAWAASAGTFITMAANVAAMAPGTSIGAASPVGGGTSEERDEEGKRTDVMGQKVENFTSAFIESIAEERDRNVEWAVKAVKEAEAIGAEEALELNVIDVIARNNEDLFEKIQGREVSVAGESRKLDLVGAEVRQIEMTTLERLFNFIANPNVATLLLMGAVLGIMLEMNSPGIFIPGAIGLACLILAVFAFDMIPFSWLGLVLMIVGMGLMIAEIFITSYGVLFGGGIVLFLLGGVMLFDMPEVSDLAVDFWAVLVPMAIGFGLVVLFVIYAVGKTFATKQTAGVSEMIGMIGRSQTAISADGRVFIRGEYWNASSDQEIPENTRVEVTDVEGMRLRVKRAETQG